MKNKNIGKPVIYMPGPDFTVEKIRIARGITKYP